MSQLAIRHLSSVVSSVTLRLLFLTTTFLATTVAAVRILCSDMQPVSLTRALPSGARLSVIDKLGRASQRIVVKTCWLGSNYVNKLSKALSIQVSSLSERWRSLHTSRQSLVLVASVEIKCPQIRRRKYGWRLIVEEIADLAVRFS